MKTVTFTKYEATDGRQFDTVVACATYEQELGARDEILLLLSTVPRDAYDRLQNGGGYIQHDPDRLAKAFDRTIDWLIAHYQPRVGSKGTDQELLHEMLACLARLKDRYTAAELHRLHYYENRCSMICGPIV